MPDQTISSSLRPGTHRVGLVTTYPPTRCGIARFSYSLRSALAEVSPDLDLDVVRLIDGVEESTMGRVGMELDPNSRVGIRAAARHLDRCDVVVLQHEYGIYGDNDGVAVIDLVESLHPPVISVLHTVVSHPGPNQRRVIEALATLSRLVVLSEAARSALATGYGVPPHRVAVIPHGTHWAPRPPNPGPRRELITWGLLGPGKGLERSIRAVAHLKDLDPRPRYRIVGRTHPAVARVQGLSYKHGLERLVAEMGVADMVEFVDRFVGDEELLELVTGSDLVVIPYDNDEQVSSGVLTEAVGAGRPVVATRFPHALELLREGAGLVVAHETESIAGAMRRLLTSHPAYELAARVAAATGTQLTWDAAARRYAKLIHSLMRRRATA